MNKLITSDGKEIIVDIDEYITASIYKWLSKADGYGGYRPVTFIEGKIKTFGSVVFGIEPDQVVFHKNGNSFDFRKDKIIVCDRSQLGHIVGSTNKKKTKYKCVHYYNKSNSWVVRLIKDGEILNGGHYRSPKDAAIVADYLIAKTFGEKAERNFPNYSYQTVEKEYLAIIEKYGIDSNTRKAKSGQGLVRCRTKTSQYIGVSKDKNKWTARIKLNKKQIHIGNFETESEAAKAYDKKAIEIYGEFAKTNF